MHFSVLLLNDNNTSYSRARDAHTCYQSFSSPTSRPYSKFTTNKNRSHHIPCYLLITRVSYVSIRILILEQFSLWKSWPKDKEGNAAAQQWPQSVSRCFFKILTEKLPNISILPTPLDGTFHCFSYVLNQPLAKPQFEILVIETWW